VCVGACVGAGGGGDGDGSDGELFRPQCVVCVCGVWYVVCGVRCVWYVVCVHDAWSAVWSAMFRMRCGFVVCGTWCVICDVRCVG
jgi:hypothetical protein